MIQPRNDGNIHISFRWHVEYSLVKLNLHESIPKKYAKITKNSSNMIVDMYTINLKKIGLNQFFFSFFLFLYV